MNYFDILLAKKLEDDRDPKVEGLSVTENGRYHEDGVVYDPVIVEVPEPTLISKSITANGTYTASDDNADGYSSVSVNVPLPSNAYLLQTKENESIATFTDGTDNFVKSLEVAIEPIQSGSGEPSPTNIRPISGWNKVNVTRCGKNLFDQTTWQYYNVSRKTNATNIPSLVTLLNSLPVGNYTFSAKFKVDTVEATQTYRNYGFFVTTTGSYRAENYTRVDSPTVGAIYETSITINKSSADMVFDAVYIYAGRGSVSDTATIYDMQLELGTIATAFESYGQTYTIDLNGTRYGGKLDVVNGIVTPAPYYASYNGEALTGEWISDRDKYEVGATPTIGAQVVNIGASDTPISIAPTIIKSLQGENNLFASTGEVIKLEYWGKEQN